MIGALFRSSARAKAKDRAKANAGTAEGPKPSTPRTKPRILVAGEFSAGKTQLINGLVGAEVLPSNVTATALPPVWLVGGSEARFAIDHGGRRKKIATLDEVSLEETLYCVLCHPAPFLERFDLIDTPGNSDPNMPSEYWERMLPYADAAIWCTNATQAWRQSEKSVWQSMPEHLVENATLVISHADLLTDARSAERVQRRVRREAGPLFDSILLASLVSPSEVAGIADHLDDLAPRLASLRGKQNSVVAEIVKAQGGTGAAAPAPQRPPKPAATEPEAAPDSAPQQAAPEPEAAPDTASQQAAPEPVTVAQGAVVTSLVPKLVANAASSPAEHPASTAQPQDAAPKGPARSLWEEISGDVDTSDAKALLACVERLLDRLDAAPTNGEAPGAKGLQAVATNETAELENPKAEEAHSLTAVEQTLPSPAMNGRQ